MQHVAPRTITALALACAVLAGAPALGQGFVASVSPPRFELALKPGGKTRQVIEIDNPGLQATKMRMQTADWSFTPDASVLYSESLVPGSCRPWVAIEAREFRVPAAGKYRYRFEIGVPENAPSGECRFALLLQGDEQPVNAGPVAFPVAGRIGIIVYVAVGDAKPDLAIVSHAIGELNGNKVPVLQVRNQGNAHGRLSGFLSGKEGGGRSIDFEPVTLPILPGETRAIALTPVFAGKEATDVRYPVTVRGTLEWGTSSTPFEATFAP
jgi:hypothetical protein